MRKAKSQIFVGIGGWTYPPWRGVFYPAGLPQKRELEYASRRLGSIEINSTYYGSQKPESFAKWHDETPDDFIFSLKGPRFATNRRVLGDAGPSIERFFASGVTELRNKLGPINWQFMPTKTFDPADFERFLKLLPSSIEGLRLRHAVEIRHPSFKTPDFVALARDYKVTVVIAGESDYPEMADITSDFVYARIMGTTASEKAGYPPKALGVWAKRAQTWAEGNLPEELQILGPPQRRTAGRDVFLYVISGHKIHNPAAAMGLIDRLAKTV